jgi:hypothetical protein
MCSLWGRNWIYIRNVDESLQTIRQLHKIIFIALYDLYVIKNLEIHKSYYLLISTLYSCYVTFQFALLSCLFKIWQKAVRRNHRNVLAMSGRVGGWVGYNDLTSRRLCWRSVITDITTPWKCWYLRMFLFVCKYWNNSQPEILMKYNLTWFLLQA